MGVTAYNGIKAYTPVIPTPTFVRVTHYLIPLSSYHHLLESVTHGGHALTVRMTVPTQILKSRIIDKKVTHKVSTQELLSPK